MKVTKILDNGQKITVTAYDSKSKVHTYVADHVIVTVPLGVLKQGLLDMKKNEAYPSTFYNFYEPPVNRGHKKRSILEEVFLHPDNSRKTLMHCSASMCRSLR